MTRSATALATTNPPGCICPVLGREGCPQHSYAGLEAMAAGLRVELERLRAVPFCGWCGHLRHDRADAGVEKLLDLPDDLVIISGGG